MHLHIKFNHCNNKVAIFKLFTHSSLLFFGDVHLGIRCKIINKNNQINQLEFITPQTIFLISFAPKSQDFLEKNLFKTSAKY